MRWIERLFCWVWNVLRSWINPAYETVIVQENLPKTLRRRTLYVVEEDGFKEQAAMLCPCGCGHVLQMNLLPDEHPCWQIAQHGDGTSSLHPSVWRQKDCGAHFWFKRGRVNWCKVS